MTHLNHNEATIKQPMTELNYNEATINQPITQLHHNEGTKTQPITKLCHYLDTKNKNHVKQVMNFPVISKLLVSSKKKKKKTVFKLILKLLRCPTLEHLCFGKTFVVVSLWAFRTQFLFVETSLRSFQLASASVTRWDELPNWLCT